MTQTPPTPEVIPGVGDLPDLTPPSSSMMDLISLFASIGESPPENRTQERLASSDRPLTFDPEPTGPSGTVRRPEEDISIFDMPDSPKSPRQVDGTVALAKKIRDAARCRRSKETFEYDCLASQLPLPTSVTDNLNKASVTRLAVCYLRLKQIYPNCIDVALQGNQDTIQPLTGLDLLEGIIFVIIPEGRFLYASETVTNVLGLSNIDIMGTDFSDFIAPVDLNDLKRAFQLEPHEIPPPGATEQDFIFDRTFILRIKCNLAIRTAGLIHDKYKVMHCYGKLKGRRVFSEDGSAEMKSLGMIVNCHVIPLVGVTDKEVRLENDMFMFRSESDLRLSFLEGRFFALTGYTAQELVGKSLYQLVHAGDIDNLRGSHQTLLAKMEEIPLLYRFLTKGGGWIWVQSYAVIVHNNRSSLPSCVISVNYVVTDVQCAQHKLMWSGEKTKDSSESLLKKRNLPEAVRLQDFCNVSSTPLNPCSGYFAEKRMRVHLTQQLQPPPPIFPSSKTSSHSVAPWPQPIGYGNSIYPTIDIFSQETSATASEDRFVYPEAHAFSLHQPALFTIENTINLTQSLLGIGNAYSQCQRTQQPQSETKVFRNFQLPSFPDRLRIAMTSNPWNRCPQIRNSSTQPQANEMPASNLNTGCLEFINNTQFQGHPTLVQMPRPFGLAPRMTSTHPMPLLNPFSNFHFPHNPL